MNVKISAVLAVLMFVATEANAFLPATGLWYNPAESGRGFGIDVQDATMVVTTYVYDASGKQIWYLSAGKYLESTSTFSATLDGSVGGQCLGCPYTHPTVLSAAGGSMKITFSDPEHGILTFPGGSTPILHFNYGYDGKTGYLYGEWAFSFNVSGLINADWAVFTTPYTGSDGTVYASGRFAGGSGIALGAWSDSSKVWLVALNDGNFTKWYVLNGSQDRMLGLAWIEPGTTSPSGSGSPATASRILTPTQTVLALTSPTSTGSPVSLSSLAEKWQAKNAELRKATIEVIH